MPEISLVVEDSGKIPCFLQLSCSWKKLQKLLKWTASDLKLPKMADAGNARDGSELSEPGDRARGRNVQIFLYEKDAED